MKYFVVSDIHSFALELKNALKDAGFDKKNPNHTLIVVGDVFDRGPDTIGVYKFLSSIPKKRCILVRGNHELLFFELMNKTFPENHDFSNHTVDTFCQIAGYSMDIFETGYWAKLDVDDPYTRIVEEWLQFKKLVKESEIYKWLQSSQWVNYYELDKYIFVHSFIPLTNVAGVPGYYCKPNFFEYRPTWREDATDTEWYDSMWGCPYALFQCGKFDEEAKQGKVLVCGHWHTSDFRTNLLEQPNKNTNIFFSDNLIALDCGVWWLYGSYFHPQNVLVIDEDGKCYDQNKRELKNEWVIVETVPYEMLTEENKDKVWKD